ncbi:non-specific lipid-transfer protein 1-like [Iris pallida]|uniref:Non-specific lipid-transfer protein 1-like n=1 Tax=Iris pallida TaxID=29817 RepID=A0AAX6IEL6_IRIPA|nr:non-specific lipid-transfer protein 1-like [Iris pallida]
MARSFISLFVLLALVVLAIAAPRAESTVVRVGGVSTFSVCQLLPWPGAANGRVLQRSEGPQWDG